MSDIPPEPGDAEFDYRAAYDDHAASRPDRTVGTMNTNYTLDEWIAATPRGDIAAWFVQPEFDQCSVWIKGADSQPHWIGDYGTETARQLAADLLAAADEAEGEPDV